MFKSIRRLLSLAVVSAVSLLPRGAGAQSNMFQACSQGPLANCSMIRLTSQLGIGPGGTNLFEIAIQNLGSQTTPTLATSIYFLSFLTGQATAPAGTEVDALAAPVGRGGATVSDPSSWSIFETGDAIFLSALGNNGVGGCAAASPVGGFGQMGRTCGADEFISFSFFTTRSFDPNAVTLAGMEMVAIANGNPSDSCNDLTPCNITATPEPSTLLLALTGLTGIVGVRFRRRATAARLTARSEA